MFYRMRLFYRMNYFNRVIFFLTELNFFKGDTNIYFKQIKKIIHIFFLKIQFFQLSFATFEQPYLHTCFYSNAVNINVQDLSIQCFYTEKKEKKLLIDLTNMLMKLVIAVVSLQHFQYTPGFPFEKTVVVLTTSLSRIFFFISKRNVICYQNKNTQKSISH